VTDAKFDITLEELEERKNEPSTTPESQRKRCPNCKGVSVVEKTDKQPHHPLREEEDFRCRNCGEHFDDPLDPSEVEVATDGGVDLPRFEYNDDGISTGDIVVDLSSGKSLQVVGKSEQTVGEHPQTRSDDTAEMFGANPDETVFQCVFLPDGEKITPPTKTYAYPESRLLRYPVERATDHAGGVQMWLRTAFLNELADGVYRSGNDDLRRDLEALITDVYSEDVAGVFSELVETNRVAADGGDER
jgi:hypothetical protein